MNTYRPDPPRDALDCLLMAHAGPEPHFDRVTADFLRTGYSELKTRASGESLVEVSSLGSKVPWLYRFDLHTLGLARTAGGQIVQATAHTIVLRFMPDCLRHTDKFEMLQYAAPREPAPWHPNICTRSGAVCIEIFPGEPVLEIVESLHDLLRWRIRQLREDDALNKDACAYGRTFVERAVDDRPLFGGASWTLQLEVSESAK